MLSAPGASPRATWVFLVGLNCQHIYCTDIKEPVNTLAQKLSVCTIRAWISHGGGPLKKRGTVVQSDSRSVYRLPSLSYWTKPPRGKHPLGHAKRFCRPRNDGQRAKGGERGVRSHRRRPTPPTAYKAAAPPRRGPLSRFTAPGGGEGSAYKMLCRPNLREGDSL